MKTAGDSLFLHEEVLLLALRGREGTIPVGMYHYALRGALLAELLLAGRVRVEVSGKRKFLARIIRRTRSATGLRVV